MSGSSKNFVDDPIKSFGYYNFLPGALEEFENDNDLVILPPDVDNLTVEEFNANELMFLEMRTDVAGRIEVVKTNPSDDHWDSSDDERSGGAEDDEEDNVSDSEHETNLKQSDDDNVAVIDNYVASEGEEDEKEMEVKNSTDGGIPAVDGPGMANSAGTVSEISDVDVELSFGVDEERTLFSVKDG
ncbi:unnamed protein product [Brassicogethes aeneus]|uniref:Uncharacterized protein n=1 Tax=Brassicogethes aeneus TaxID=1431903 RepID=A0A9P0BA97_BRAAE|nr:unnamed protein product [Brassicogethes aeneus]